MQILNKSQARALGLKRYFTGKLCKHGHLAERDLKGHCVECRRLEIQDWSRRNPEKRRAYYLRDMAENREARLASKRLDSKTPRAKAAGRLRRTGWTQARYDAALVEQGGCCAVSGQSATPLYADHDHSAGRTRGLLHNRINLGLGAFDDNPEWLYNAAVYVLTHRPLLEWIAEYEPGGRAF